MQETLPLKPAVPVSRRVLLIAGAMLFVAVVWKFAVADRTPPPPSFDAAAAAALQHAAFARAEAQVGFSRPETIPVEVQRGETLESAVERAGVARTDAHYAVETLAQAMDTVHIKAGMAFEAAIARPLADQGSVRLVGLSLRTGPASAITLSRSFDGALRLRQMDEKVRDETVVANGVIAGSLYESAERLGATPAITTSVVRLFAHKLDFQRDLDTGDTFKLVFDRKVTDSGRTIAAGDLEYAELRGVKFYRFERTNGGAEYFDEFGKNIKGLLLRTPIDGGRITSLFGMRRHPVLGFTRAHQGIDFAAGTGAPIVAAGDGVVLQAARWGGYGNWLRIRHTGGWDTGYGHISRYATGIRPGMRVHQGQVVAYVGSTGLATGPHLHYEVWKDGQRQNPIGAKIPQGTVLAGAELDRFEAKKAHVDGLLAGNGRRQLASTVAAALQR